MYDVNGEGADALDSPALLAWVTFGFVTGSFRVRRLPCVIFVLSKVYAGCDMSVLHTVVVPDLPFQNQP